MESVNEGNSELQYGLTFRDMRIEDLCLDFTLPGYPDIVLASGTNHSMVGHLLDILSFYLHFRLLLNINFTYLYFL